MACVLAAQDDAADAEFTRIAERYWQVLMQRPRKGTALDLWHRHYAQDNRLDELRERVQQAIADDPSAPQPHLLHGILLERDRKPSEALESYQTAERLAEEDYYPAYCRGMLLFAQQRYPEAAEALKRAVSLRPPRDDLLDLVETQVRCHFRVGNQDAAHRAITDFSAVIQADRHALRRLAEVVTTEGDAGLAIELWQQIVQRPQSDPLARITARIEIAQLHVDQGQNEKAVDLFREALGQLNPDGWLARDVCRRIERTYLRDSNTAGLVEFWKEQNAKLPQDLQTLQQLAGALRHAGRIEEATEVYRRAIELAPAHVDLRRAYIDMLVDLRELDEAIRQCESMLGQSGNDVEVLRMLGQLYLKAAADDEQEAAQQRAIAIWQRIADSSEGDPAAAVQAAEAARHASLIPTALRIRDERLRTTARNSQLLAAAERFYRAAVDRAVAKDHHLAVPYLEQLGEFLHARQQPEQAIATWQSIYAPPHDTADLLLEASNIFRKYGYLPEAEEAARRATGLDRQSYRAAELLIEVLLEQQDFAAAFAELNRLDDAADTSLRQSEARRLRVQVCSGGKFTEREIQRLTILVSGNEPVAEDLWLLGLLHASAANPDEAAAALKRAVELAAEDPRLVRDYADVLQIARKFDQAARQYERLLVLEPHRRVTHWRALVDLQLRQGNYEQARQLVENLVALAPDDSATYQLRVEVAGRTGDRQEQVALLHQAVRAAPNDVDLRRQLAHTLADWSRFDEAFGEYWRCWELTPALSDRVTLVASMTELLERTGARQRLIDRLRDVQRSRPREGGICLAEVYRRCGEFASARRTLTALLAEDDRDVDVLRQLAALAAEETDWETALSYQRQVVNLDKAWTGVLEWARYYSESRRDQWLSDSRERQRQLMRAWVETFRAYRQLMQDPEPSDAKAQTLRQELINLNWARNKYFDKQQLLDPQSTYQRRYGNVWHQLRLDFEILELASGGPVTTHQIERRLAEPLRSAGTSAQDVLGKLCEKGFLEERSVDGEVRYVSKLPADELLAIAVRDFGERMLGGEIELSDMELIKLQRVVDGVATADEPTE